MISHVLLKNLKTCICMRVLDTCMSMHVLLSCIYAQKLQIFQILACPCIKCDDLKNILQVNAGFCKFPANTRVF